MPNRTGTATRNQGPTVDAEELTNRVLDDPDAELEDHEARWLQDHDMLPDTWERVPVTFIQGGQEVSNDPNFFAQQRVQDEDRFNAEVERRAKAMAKEMVKAEQHEARVAGVEYTGNAVGVPEQVSGNEGFEPDNSAAEGDDDYNSWHSDELRAELVRRDLSVGGNKAALVQRLEDDDQGLAESGEEE